MGFEEFLLLFSQFLLPFSRIQDETWAIRRQISRQTGLALEMVLSACEIQNVVKACPDGVNVLVSDTQWYYA